MFYYQDPPPVPAFETAYDHGVSLSRYGEFSGEGNSKVFSLNLPFSSSCFSLFPRKRSAPPPLCVNWRSAFPSSIIVFFSKRYWVRAVRFVHSSADFPSLPFPFVCDPLLCSYCSFSASFPPQTKGRPPMTFLSSFLAAVSPCSDPDNNFPVVKRDSFFYFFLAALC